MPEAVTPDGVRGFWFGEGGWSNAKMWFEAGRDLDPVVRQRFLKTVEAAIRGEYDHDPAWVADPHDRICLVIVLDQFTRHVYRDHPRFVRGDARARGHVLAMLDAGEDAALASEEKLFLLTVLEHAEDRDIQKLALATARRYAAEHPDELGEMERYVLEHKQIVDRFGRLPDRNHVLGRVSTPEDAAFLAETQLPWFERQGPS